MKPDWRIYQVRIDGVDKLVGDMTIDELRLALCQSIDALEDVGAGAADMSERIECWRNGSGPQEPSATKRKQRRAKSKS